MNRVGGNWRVGSVAVECPTCSYRVPAEWSLCRRCGASLHPEPEDSRVAIPASMQRAHSGSQIRPTAPTLAAGPTSSALVAIAAARRNGPPGSTPQHLAPAALTRPSVAVLSPAARAPRDPLRARLGASASRHWRRIVVFGVVGVALVMSLVAAWPVVFRPGPTSSAPSPSAARAAVAADLLYTVIGGERALFATRNSLVGATPANVSRLSYRVPVVAATTVAQDGVVSMHVDNARQVTLATPADAERCVFARDRPVKQIDLYVTVHMRNCRASAAPTTGWSER